MVEEVVRFLISDKFIACLLPLALLLLGLHFVGGLSISDRAVLSYEQYARLSENELSMMRSSYSKLGRAHKRIGYALGYSAKLDLLRDAIGMNAKITNRIAGLARTEFGDVLEDSSFTGTRGDLGRVRESLKHFMRDWSEEGRGERERIFEPILNVLREVKPQIQGSMKVLVPGSGLGRLAWEISRLGFDTTANELSFFMNLAFRFLLSTNTTQYPNQHVLQPYASWFSHQRTSDALFRHVSFPDVVPRLGPSTLQLSELNFLSLRAPAGDPPGYDFIVTLFFIDTSLNVIETLEQIHALLRPGGTWINLGPLLWTGGGQAAVELSLEEVLRLVKIIGFEICEDGSRKRRTVECEYTADREAMMRWLYQAEFWVATKAEA